MRGQEKQLVGKKRKSSQRPRDPGGAVPELRPPLGLWGSPRLLFQGFPFNNAVTTSHQNLPHLIWMINFSFQIHLILQCTQLQVTRFMEVIWVGALSAIWGHISGPSGPEATLTVIYNVQGGRQGLWIPAQTSPEGIVTGRKVWSRVWISDPDPSAQSSSLAHVPTPILTIHPVHLPTSH